MSDDLVKMCKRLSQYAHAQLSSADLERIANRIEELEAKLAKMIKAWETEDDSDEDPDYGPQSSAWWAAMHEAIAELKGQDDEYADKWED